MPDRKHALVVYYSLSGNTERVARALAEQLGADVERVRERTARHGFLGYVRAAFDSLRERPTVLIDFPKNADDYDLTIVGTPIWAGKITPAVRTILKSIRGHARRVAFFTTSGNTPAERVVPTMEKLSDQGAVAFVGFTDRELRDPAVYWNKLGKFVAALRAEPVLPANERMPQMQARPAVEGDMR